MKQKKWMKWLKPILIGIGIVVFFIYAVIVPELGRDFASGFPEYAYCYTPCLIFVSLTAIPIYIAIFYAWRLFSNIQKDQSFCVENARFLKRISQLAYLDAGYFLLGNIVLLFLNLSQPGIAIFSLILVFMGLAIAVLSDALSSLVYKASDLQEESELTI